MVPEVGERVMLAVVEVMVGELVDEMEGEVVEALVR